MMYDAFEPKGCVQGMPPVADYTRRTWVEAIMGNSWNFVLRERYKVVGHAAAIADKRRKEAEYLIFVLPNYQKQGLGITLTELAMDYLRRRGIRRVFSKVQLSNIRAIQLYRKFNFDFSPQGDDSRCIMACTLEQAA
ncbi:MAG: GNAT family N-acetyltransferase [Deltaproteobacteria bacterium]|nr:GNAT family N-acetyltransferase [Deltaproteobacteria bacterium]